MYDKVILPRLSCFNLTRSLIHCSLILSAIFLKEWRSSQTPVSAATALMYADEIGALANICKSQRASLSVNQLKCAPRCA